MPKQKTISAKHAQSLRTEIRHRNEAITQQLRELQHAQDALHEEKVRAAALQIELDGLAVKVDKMGKDVGFANMREMVVREIAATALNGMATVASGVQGVSSGQIAMTLRALERDGREQLKKATNGAHA